MPIVDEKLKFKDLSATIQKTWTDDAGLIALGLPNEPQRANSFGITLDIKDANLGEYLTLRKTCLYTQQIENVLEAVAWFHCPLQPRELRITIFTEAAPPSFLRLVIYPLTSPQGQPIGLHRIPGKAHSRELATTLDELRKRPNAQK